MMPLALYCKSYRTDVKRVVRLAQSIARYNSDQIPFYVSAPQSDLELFAQHLQGRGDAAARLGQAGGHHRDRADEREDGGTKQQASEQDGDCVEIKTILKSN